MTNVIEMQMEGAGEQTSGLRSIRLGSRVLAGLFTALLVIWALIMSGILPAVLAYTGDRLQICSKSAWIGLGHEQAPLGCKPFALLPVAQRVAYALVASLRAAPTLMILWHLRGLFRLYSDGVIFSPANATHLKLIGLWLVIAAFVPMAGHLFLAVTGMEIDKAWLHLASLQELILGALVFVIAQVMQFGHQLEEDQRRFV